MKKLIIACVILVAAGIIIDTLFDPLERPQWQQPIGDAPATIDWGWDK